MVAVKSREGRFRESGYELKQHLGTGSGGNVHEVIRQENLRVHALKEIDLREKSRQEQQECIREAIVLAECRDSAHVLKYYDAFISKAYLHIVTEYASGGDLGTYIDQNEAFPEELIWKLLAQMLLGLNHMHSLRIWHRDIKMQNLFLTADLDIKLGDMGIAKKLGIDEFVSNTRVGTPKFMSPELRAGQMYNEKVDVWALGVVLYYCCTKTFPSTSEVQENSGSPVPDVEADMNVDSWRYSADMKDIIKRCLTQEATWRPDTYQLLLLPSVRGRMASMQGLRPTTAQATFLRLAAPSPSR